LSNVQYIEPHFERNLRAKRHGRVQEHHLARLRPGGDLAAQFPCPLLRRDHAIVAGGPELAMVLENRQAGEHDTHSKHEYPLWPIHRVHALRGVLRASRYPGAQYPTHQPR
jgi:hypothetical protein